MASLSPPSWKTALLLAAAAFLLAMVHLPLFDDNALGPGFETVALARALADGRGFSDPYATLHTGPSALCPPVYPGLLSGVFLLMGYGPASAVALVLLSLLFRAAQVALLPLAAHRMLEDARPGWWAAALLAVLPISPTTIQHEYCLQAAILTAMACMPARRGWAAAWGAAAALALHVNPSSLFFLAGWAIWRKPAWRWTAVAAATLLLACLPWALRNFAVFGHPIFIRNNLGLELRISNNDLAAARYDENTASFHQFHPNYNPAEAAAAANQGEYAYMQRQFALATSWISSHPSQFAAFTAQRIRFYWLPSLNERPWQTALISALTLLSIPGMFLLRRHPVFAVSFTLCPLLYYVVQADPRYRYPYLWLSLIAVGVAAQAARQRFATRLPQSDR